jgi:hypothetical protein
MKRCNEDMKKKVIYFGIGTSLILILLIISYTIFQKEQNIANAINSISQVIIAISSLIMTMLAFLFYDKFEIGKKILHNQIETVFAFLKELQTIEMIIQAPENASQKICIFFKISNLIRNRNTYNNMIEGETLFFDTEYYNNKIKSLSDFRNNILLPKDISYAIDKLFFEYSKCITIPNLANTLILIVGRSNAEIGDFNGKSLTLKEFTVSWLELIDKSREFIKKNNSKNIDNMNI